MNIFYTIIFLFSILAISSFFYLSSDLHKHAKFNGYLQFLGAFAIIFTIIALIIQTSSNREKVTADSISFYSNLKKEFVEEHFKLFMQYPQLNYYYNELMGIKYNLPSNRNYILENQITMVIFARLSTVLYFINENKQYEIVTKKSLDDLENKVVEMMSLYFKSTIFQENWKFYYNTIAGDNVINFVKKYFPNYI